MSLLGQAEEAVEHGLLTANAIKGLAPARMNLSERMAFYNVPGFSIAIIDREEIALAKGYGVLEAGVVKPVTDKTIFQAASISKPITAMLALNLVESGSLDLDGDVNAALHSWHIPEGELSEDHKVTLRGLLTHNAGINVPGYRGYPYDEQIPNLRQILDGKSPAISEPVRLVQAPGQGFRYSGGGYMIVQQLIEDASGRPLADLARELVFDKLEMTNSNFNYQLHKSNAEKSATAHRNNGDPVPGKWHFYPEQAAASLWSTPSDLARVIIEVIKSEKGQSNLVLSSTMTKEMLTPLEGWMGLGYVSVKMDGWRRFDHPGWNEGFHSYMAGFLDAGQGIVWMTNGENGKLLGYEVMRGLAKLFGWPELEQMEKNISQVNSAGFARLEGTYLYVDEPDFSVEIVNDGAHLFIQESQGGNCFQLYPESEIEFFCLPRTEKISFIKNSEGIVETMMIGHERLAREGQM